MVSLMPAKPAKPAMRANAVMWVKPAKPAFFYRNAGVREHTVKQIEDPAGSSGPGRNSLLSPVGVAP